SPPRALRSFPTRRSSDLLQRPLEPMLMKCHPTDARPECTERMDVAVADSCPVDEFDAELESGLRLRHQLALVQPDTPVEIADVRSEEHTSELQSRENLVC